MFLAHHPLASPDNHRDQRNLGFGRQSRSAILKIFDEECPTDCCLGKTPMTSPSRSASRGIVISIGPGGAIDRNVVHPRISGPETLFLNTESFAMNRTRRLNHQHQDRRR